MDVDSYFDIEKVLFSMKITMFLLKDRPRLFQNFNIYFSCQEKFGKSLVKSLLDRTESNLPKDNIINAVSLVDNYLVGRVKSNWLHEIKEVCYYSVPSCHVSG